MKLNIKTVLSLAIAQIVFFLPKLAQAADGHLFNPDHIDRAGALCLPVPEANDDEYTCTVFVVSTKDEPIIYLTSEVQYGHSWEHVLTPSSQWAEARAQLITQQFREAIYSAREQRKMLHIGVSDGYQTIVNFDKYLAITDTNIPTSVASQADEFDVRIRDNSHSSRLNRASEVDVQTSVQIEK